MTEFHALGDRFDDASSEPTAIEAFRRECSVRRALEVLSVKHRRLEADLQQFVQHLKLLVPGIEPAPGCQLDEVEILEEALARLDDEAFSGLLLRILERNYRRG
ncbi:MAG: hypothetical protein HC824_13375 [Synechococcales cyanobacterium RM1_1_8]|nr:hypothetical protein [Synechococcales cyanobacterium RM1_1_8]